MKDRILVIKLSALGDFILALGAMEAIRRKHPDAHITLLTTRLFTDMAQRSRYFDEVWTERRAKFWDVKAWYALARKLNAGNFSRVYDLQMNDRTKVYRALFLKKPEWSGVIPGGPLSYVNPEWKEMHAFKRHQEVLKLAGIDVGLPDISWMDTDVSLLKPKSPYILFIPGSAPRHPQKRWPAVKYGALARKLMQEGYQVAALGTAAEADVIANIRKACPDVIDLSGRTSFYDIAALARGAAGAVGNDTGPTHLVALAGCPVVVLFSTRVSRPERSAPVGDVQVIQSEDLNDVGVDVVLGGLKPRKAD